MRPHSYFDKFSVTQEIIRPLPAIARSISNNI
jgi:hypothetical protein